MYHIRRADTKEERSIYKEDLEGLTMAAAEARMRTMHTGVAHEIVSDDHIVLTKYEPEIHAPLQPDEVVEPVKLKLSGTWFLMSAAIMAAVLLKLIGG